MLSDFCNAYDFVFIYVHILFNTIKKCVNEKKLYDGRFFFFSSSLRVNWTPKVIILFILTILR